MLIITGLFNFLRLKKELKTRKNLNSFGKNSRNTKNTLLKTVNKFSKKASKILKISEDIFLKYIEKIPQNKSNVFTCKQHLTRPLKYHLPKLKSKHNLISLQWANDKPRTLEIRWTLGTNFSDKIFRSFINRNGRHAQPRQGQCSDYKTKIH